MLRLKVVQQLCFLLFASGICPLYGYASMEHKIKPGKKVKVTGIGVASSVSLARSRALDDARVKALEKAGIPTSVDNMIIESENSDAQGFISSVTLLNVGGEVVIEEKEFKEEVIPGTEKVKCIAYVTARVTPYKEQPNPSLNVIMNQPPKVAYRSMEAFNLSFTPQMDLYARLFFVDGKGLATMIYPNPSCPSRLLPAGKRISLPCAPGIKLEADQEEAEHIQFVLVLLEEEVASKGMETTAEEVKMKQNRKVSRKTLYEWASSISRSQRALKVFPAILK